MDTRIVLGIIIAVIVIGVIAGYLLLGKPQENPPPGTKTSPTTTETTGTTTTTQSPGTPRTTPVTPTPTEPGKLLFAAYYYPENNTVELIITVKAYTNITITKLVIDNTTPDNPLYTYLVKTYSPPINLAPGESWTTKIIFQPPAQQAQDWKIGTRHTAYLTITYGQETTILKTTALLTQPSTG